MRTVIVGTVSASWVILFLWTNTPYSANLGHGELQDVSSATQLLSLTVVFLVGWILMLIAMMIPAARPFVAQFRLKSSVNNILASAICGFLAVWALFGLAVYFSDLGIHTLAGSPLLKGNTWVLGSSVLVLATGYQFTSTKDRFLRDCCYPSYFIQSHWRSGAGKLGAIRLGFRYGKASVGSCWAFMLLLFALGLGSVTWMGVLTLVMVAESLSKWGPRIRIPVGIIFAGITSYSLLGALGL